MSNSKERVVIRYSDGTEAQVGDTVLIDEKQRGVVREVVDTPEKMESWALDEFGLMFDGLFLPQRFLHEYPVELISRVAA
jgi:hypothetical protein